MKKVLTLILFALVGLFSCWLMVHSLSSSQGDILVGLKYWSDFAAQLPLIRSFSLGSNWPPEHPLFPGAPIKYHFLFYQLVAAWEAIGLPLSLALNIPSIIGFVSFIFLIWLVSFRLFRSYLVSFLSVVFSLFNGSLSWLEFLKSNPLSSLPSLSSFVGFGPWNGSLVSAFWNLNIYTNQRHLAYSFAVVLLIIYSLLSTKKYLPLLTGFLIGLLLIFNQPAAVIASLFVISFFTFSPSLRLKLFVSSLGGIPWLIVYWMFISTPSLPTPSLSFLLPGPLTLASFVNYWFYNIGLHLILIPLGLCFSWRKSKYFILPLLILFIAPNLWRFSPDIINNHKFFNFFLVIGGIFSASIISKLISLKFIGLPIVILLSISLVMGGIVDLFPIKNDTYYSLPDIKSSPVASFYLSHTPKDAVILNSTWFYHPASLAGRKIFNGYSYFTWSYGYDQTTRELITKNIFASSSMSQACAQLLENDIDFVDLSISPESFLVPNYAMWNNNFESVYTSPTNDQIFDVKKSCL